MKISKLVILTALASLTVSVTLQAGTNKAADSSALATAPIYDQTGVLGSDSFGDTGSFTDSQGNTSYVTCVRSDCFEGVGMSYWVTLPDKTRLSFSPDRGVDLDHWTGRDGYGTSMIYPTADAHLETIPGQTKGQTISFRFRTAAVIAVEAHGITAPPKEPKRRFFCVPLKIDMNGKTRIAYAKHHSMEACYTIYG
jgi:hypothetical protein